MSNETLTLIRLMFGDITAHLQQVNELSSSQKTLVNEYLRNLEVRTTQGLLTKQQCVERMSAFFDGLRAAQATQFNPSFFIHRYSLAD